MYGLNAQLGGDTYRSYNYLQKSRAALSTSLERLASGYRVNRASDDPSAMRQGVELITRHDATEASIRINQNAFYELARVDEVHGVMAQRLSDIRVKILDARSEWDPDIQQTIALQVASLVEEIDQFATGTFVGDQAVLDGTGRISLNASASDLLQVSSSTVYRARRGADIYMDFDRTEFASQAYIRDAYVAPAADSTYEITINDSDRRVTLAAGTNAVDAANAIDSAIREIGGFAQEVGGDLVIATSDYGADQTLNVTKLSGDDIVGAGFLGVDQTGVDGTVNINGQDIALDGDLVLEYSNGAFAATLAFDPADVARDVTAGGGVSTPANDRFVHLQTGGGLNLFTGPDAIDENSLRLGFATLTASGLGLDSILQGGSNDLVTNPDDALAVVDRAAAVVNRAMTETANTMNHNLQDQNANLQNLLGQLAQQRDGILEADAAYEAARAAKAQFMQEAAINVMGVQNARYQSVLSLLGVSG